MSPDRRQGPGQSRQLCSLKFPPSARVCIVECPRGTQEPDSRRENLEACPPKKTLPAVAPSSAPPMWKRTLDPHLAAPGTRQVTWVQSLGWEDPLEEGMATHSCILAWRICLVLPTWQAGAKSWAWGDKEATTHAPRELTGRGEDVRSKQEMDGMGSCQNFRGERGVRRSFSGDKDDSVENWTMGRGQPDEEESEDCSR